CAVGWPYQLAWLGAVHSSSKGSRMNRQSDGIAIPSWLLSGAIALLAACSSGDGQTSTPGGVEAGAGADGGTATSEGGAEAAPEGSDAAPRTLYLVGDSTVAAFNDPYYYPRYGYGTQIGNYLSPSVTVDNLALSGRSSKSFIDPADNGNYAILTSSLK